MRATWLIVSSFFRAIDGLLNLPAGKCKYSSLWKRVGKPVCRRDTVKRFSEIFPSVEELLELEPEDIAPLVLEWLNQGDGRNLSRYNFTRRGSELSEYAGDRYDEVARVATEAWMVLSEMACWHQSRRSRKVTTDSSPVEAVCSVKEQIFKRIGAARYSRRNFSTPSSLQKRSHCFCGEITTWRSLDLSGKLRRESETQRNFQQI